MKLDRLLSIVILLLNRRLIQAKELADRFEVSVRTIYRDIETINLAGIPIVTYQGANGGIGLADGYRLDRNVLTNDELAAIVTALRSISTSYDNPDNQLLLEKINSIVPPASAEQFQHKSTQIIVDFSPWGSPGHLENKLLQLKQAISDCVVIRFAYSDMDGQLSRRSVEPHTLVLKGRQWYLQAYCQERRQFRLFKLMRMKELEARSQTFSRKALPDEGAISKDWNQSPSAISFTLRIGREIRHVAEEWFGIEELQPQADGSWVVQTRIPENEWLYGFILSLGPAVEVLEPERLRDIISERAKRIHEVYDQA